MATSSKRLEELLNNILQEFQYGYNVSETTNSILKSDYSILDS